MKMNSVFTTLLLTAGLTATVNTVDGQNKSGPKPMKNNSTTAASKKAADAPMIYKTDHLEIWPHQDEHHGVLFIFANGRNAIKVNPVGHFALDEKDNYVGLVEYYKDDNYDDAPFLKVNDPKTKEEVDFIMQLANTAIKNSTDKKDIIVDEGGTLAKLMHGPFEKLRDAFDSKPVPRAATSLAIETAEISCDGSKPIVTFTSTVGSQQEIIAIGKGKQFDSKELFSVVDYVKYTPAQQDSSLFIHTGKKCVSSDAAFVLKIADEVCKQHPNAPLVQDPEITQLIRDNFSTMRKAFTESHMGFKLSNN